MFTGTFIIERVLGILGIFNVDRTRVSFIPALGHFGKASRAHSPSQALYMNLVIFSIVHAMNFVMMGSRDSFPVLILAYVVSALSRAMIQASLYVSLESV